MSWELSKHWENNSKTNELGDAWYFTPMVSQDHSLQGQIFCTNAKDH